MLQGHHPPTEEYLEAVFELEEDGIPVIQARLAERLGHSAPTVSETMRNLRASGYVEMEGRIVRLTDEGRLRAVQVIRRHRLAERLLTDVIGVEWHKSHLEATRWEHVISDDVESRLVTLLDDPATCPHGNPIPGTRRVLPELVRLSTADVGDEVCLERVAEQLEWDTEVLTFLGENGLVPGTVATVVSRSPSGDLTLAFAGKQLEVGAAIAIHLHITA